MKKIFIFFIFGFLGTSLFAQTPSAVDAGRLTPKSAVSLLLPRNPNNRQPPPEIGMQVEKFFVALSQDKVDEAFQFLLAKSEYIQKKYQVDEFIQKTKQAITVYGKLYGYELYDNKKVGSRLIVLTYFIYLKEVPLRWRLIYYAADSKNWRLINLSVDDLMDESLLAE